MSRPIAAVLLSSAVTIAVASCADAPGDEPSPVLVFAAGSLSAVFSDLEAAFESTHPDVDVRLSVAASSALREQILEGAPADVFASADPSTMDAVVDAGLSAGDPAVFATNRMLIAVPSGNPARVGGLDAFADPSLVIGLCAPQVPCGIYGREVLRAAGISPSPDTDEPNVRSLLTKIEEGELDAGLVYATDVGSSDRVEGIEFPPEWNVTARYPIAILVGAADGASEFVEFVHSNQGLTILAEHGFGPP